jgi:hypothetical protein
VCLARSSPFLQGGTVLFFSFLFIRFDTLLTPHTTPIITATIPSPIPSSTRVHKPQQQLHKIERQPQHVGQKDRHLFNSQPIDHPHTRTPQGSKGEREVDGSGGFGFDDLGEGGEGGGIEGDHDEHGDHAVDLCGEVGVGEEDVEEPEEEEEEGGGEEGGFHV